MPSRLRSLPTPRFSLKSLLVLMLGVAVGYSLNLYTLRLLVGPGSESAMTALPTYVIEPPDVVAITLLDQSAELAPLEGERLVGPDGRISLGELGGVAISGLTIEEARAAIEKKLADNGHKVRLILDVHAYNSKKYLVITKNGAGGDSITQLPITGNDTVLDAMASVGGVKNYSNTAIYISRPSARPNGVAQVLPVNYHEVVQGVTRTNYQLLPGDRLFIEPKLPTAAQPKPLSGVQAIPIPVDAERRGRSA
ncbi:Polysaccharide biosynthesis/export protein [Posidoniimonas corsicana]|uniref:Polysaccharide biosynthesis/export protein n=1 Tax=Posidoniimonas corsicana TaxID=1938618 RepID=A0A5C5VG24_9BACT|nr:polysaccharide biosynthesis/export family protein [Posidoniimonas corsicana]TWT37051.1 Polysaccharide biosynthesis/export protein [Posidoniimonas corsicana]